jgi:hypothetical protein
VYNLKNQNVPKWNEIQKLVKIQIDGIKKDRITTRTWFHFDMDMFFAACEI